MCDVFYRLDLKYLNFLPSYESAIELFKLERFSHYEPGNLEDQLASDCFAKLGNWEGLVNHLTVDAINGSERDQERLCLAQ